MVKISSEGLGGNSGEYTPANGPTTLYSYINIDEVYTNVTKYLRNKAREVHPFYSNVMSLLQWCEESKSESNLI